MRVVYCKQSCLSVLAAAFVPAILFAQQAPVRAGLHYGEVASLKGPALSKQEQESRRRDIWTYSGDKLIFREWRLEKWGDMPMEAETSLRPLRQNIQPPAEVSTSAKQPLARGRNQPLTVPLMEILRDVPSEEEEKGHAASAPGVPGMPMGPRGILPFETGRQDVKKDS